MVVRNWAKWRLTKEQIAGTTMIYLYVRTYINQSKLLLVMVQYIRKNKIKKVVLQYRERLIRRQSLLQQI